MSTWSNPPNNFALVGSHKWVLKNYRAAAEYMDRSKASLSSDIFYLDSLLGVDDEVGTGRALIRRVPFQIKGWMDGRGDLSVRLYCGWSRPADADEEQDDTEDPQAMLHAHYSFSIQASGLRGSSKSSHDYVRYSSFKDKLQPMDSSYRSFSAATNGRPTDIDHDLAVIADIKVVVPPPRGNSNKKSGAMLTLEKLFHSKEFSDVTLITSGGRSFPAHRVLLSARSSVFATMFSHPEMLEHTTKEVVMDDAQPLVVERMLKFLYTDKFDVRGHATVNCLTLEVRRCTFLLRLEPRMEARTPKGCWRWRRSMTFR